MQIYNNGIRAKEFKRFLWKKEGALLLRLTGVNMVYTSRKIDIHPIYKPLLFYQASRGSLRIELSGKVRMYRLIFLRRKPFISIEIITKLEEIIT